VGDDSERVGEPVIAYPVSEPPTKPNKLARVLATVIVSSLTASLMTKLLGRRAGLVAMLLSASAHEILDAPLARFFGKRLRFMAT
jgi:hypothetical protein